MATKGRPRDADAEERILAAALAELSRAGYRAMSIDAVARAAGVSKPTIYRRWKGKEDLATAAVRRLQQAEPRACEGSNLERLVAILRNFRRSLLRPNGMALLGTVLAEEHRTPRLLSLFRERLVASRRAMLRQVLDDARNSGEVREDADLDAAVACLVGSFYARYLAGQPIPPEWADRAARLVWRAITP